MSLASVKKSVKDEEYNKMYAQYDSEFKTFLLDNLDFSRLNINKMPPSKRLFRAYEYFEGIPQFIQTYFEPGEINGIQYDLIEQCICDYVESLKKQHHFLLLTILAYLPIRDIILKISLLNRKLYIVSGDLSLLQKYYPKYDKFQYKEKKDHFQLK